MTHEKNPRIFFPNLHGLRFVGALAVMFFHCFTLNREIWGDFYNGYWFQKAGIVLGKGHLGVILFFVLSGFLITYLLLDESTRKGRINLVHYLMRRFLRVWPLYFVIVLFGFFVFPHLPYGIETVHEFWRYALFLSNIDEVINGMRDSINFLTATWSVSVEEQFYLTWGVLIGLIAFRKKQTYLYFFCAVILTSLVFRYFHLDDHRSLYYHTFSVMSDLAIGGVIGLWAFNGGAQRAFENIPRWAIVLGYIAGCSLLVLEGHLFRGVFFIFERFVPGIVFAFILLEQVYSKHSFFKIDRVWGFYNSGKLTYGFYMFHCIFIYYWAIFFRNHGLTENLFHYCLFILAVFVSTYALAWISFYYFEEQFLKLKRFFRS
jgi:peptidoglycan/LPS O-acetylase OafA/YrhL